jgi:transcriptional regulator
MKIKIEIKEADLKQYIKESVEDIIGSKVDEKDIEILICRDEKYDTWEKGHFKVAYELNVKNAIPNKKIN